MNRKSPDPGPDDACTIFIEGKRTSCRMQIGLSRNLIKSISRGYLSFSSIPISHLIMKPFLLEKGIELRFLASMKLDPA
jgi:hypothetical protein